MKKKKQTNRAAVKKVWIGNAIVLKDRKGNTRMSLEASDQMDNSRITLFGRNGESISVTVDCDSTCMVGLLHKSGRVGASISIDSGGQSHLILSGCEGSHLLRVETSPEIHSKILLHVNGKQVDLDALAYSHKRKRKGAAH